MATNPGSPARARGGEGLLLPLPARKRARLEGGGVPACGECCCSKKEEARFPHTAADILSGAAAPLSARGR